MHARHEKAFIEVFVPSARWRFSLVGSPAVATQTSVNRHGWRLEKS
jgi:hypothetical protein